mmetsp:Transcript_34205/g.25272  ORF Transcript_34205/g.25272 Transcript_34205/m.25272 type:complete len:150 (+) Transcript_34205:20-469(+)
MQLAKALSWMALNGHWSTPKFDLDTGVTARAIYETPESTFFILGWLYSPFPNAPGVTYVKNPTPTSPNWPPKLDQIFLNKGGIFDILARSSVSGRAADGTEVVNAGTILRKLIFPLEAKDLFLERMNQAYESLDILENLSTNDINLLES